jgi:hypothetical protein
VGHTLLVRSSLTGLAAVACVVGTLLVTSTGNTDARDVSRRSGATVAAGGVHAGPPAEVTSPAPTVISPSSGKRSRPTATAAVPDRVVVRRADGAVILDAPVDPIQTQAPVIDPPIWGRAVFWTGSALPRSPSGGTTLIYGHACLHHVCPFTSLHAAQPGASVVLYTAAATFTYTVNAVRHQPKAGMGDYSFGNSDIGLITCVLPDEGSVDDNRIVLGTLTSVSPSSAHE